MWIFTREKQKLSTSYPQNVHNFTLTIDFHIGMLIIKTIQKSKFEKCAFVFFKLYLWQWKSLILRKNLNFCLTNRGFMNIIEMMFYEKI